MPASLPLPTTVPSAPSGSDRPERPERIDLRSHFGFRQLPFTREIAPGHLLTLDFFHETVEALYRTIEARMSAALIGPAGTGKTHLLRYLLTGLPEARYRVHYVKVTSLSKRDMCREIAAACGAAPAGSYPALVRKLQERFDASATQDGVRSVLILDESHELRPDVLAMLRVLTNFDMDSRLVLSVILSGQSSLRSLLARDDQEAIARRIAHYAQLRLLGRDEFATYVTHRCALAGLPTPPFEDTALDALYELSRGNLRAIDSLAYKALEHAAITRKTTVSVQHLIAARKDVFA